MRLSKTLILISILGLIVVSGQDNGSTDAGANDNNSSNDGTDNSGGGSSDSTDNSSGSDGTANDNTDTNNGSINQTDTSGIDNSTSINNNTAEGGGGAVTVITTPGEEFLRTLANLANNIQGTALPSGAANNLVVNFEDLQQNSEGIQQLAELSSQDVSGNERIAQYFSILDSADSRAYPEIDRQLAALFREANQDECYNEFTASIYQIYFGWVKYRSHLTGQSLLSVTEAARTFSDFCDSESSNLEQHVENLANMLLGVSGCDALQLLYDGSIDSNIWTGWRDNIDDKAAYMVMYLTEGIVLLNACAGEANNTSNSEVNNSTENNSTDNSTDNATSDQLASSQQNLDKYNQFYEDAITRVLQFDRLARSSVQQTVSQNLAQLLKASQGLSLEVMALNVNGYALASIYYDFLWQMGAVYSNTSRDDFYVECWNCAEVIQGDFWVYVAWLPKDSTASLLPSQFDNFTIENELVGESISGTGSISNETGSSNNSTGNNSTDIINAIDNSTENNNTSSTTTQIDSQTVATQVWAQLGNCTSGVYIFNNTIPYYVNTQFAERVIFRLGGEVDIYAWGINEFCYGRPLTV